jgi:hypothetical protein
MKIPAIKLLAETATIEELKLAEEALYNEQQPAITVPGDDEGEQLTHVLAALWIREEMEVRGIAFPAALREYTSRVRNSIS